MTTHPIAAVQRLENHVDRLLHVLDVEYAGDTPNRLPERLIEMYRTTLVAARGIPAIDATAAWAHAHVSYELPMSFFAQLDHAKASLRERKTADAQNALHRANGGLVTEVPNGLSIQEMATVAALSSTLVTIAELVNIGMSCDWVYEPADVWPLLTDPETGRLTEILVQTIHHDLRGEGADGITPDLVRQTIATAHPHDHAGLLIVLWAAGEGTLRRMRHLIDERTRKEAAESASLAAEFAVFAVS